MTEAEWLVCTDPQEMLKFLGGNVSERKRRLFAVACCWRVSDLLTASAKAGLTIAEQLADGVTSLGKLHKAWKAGTGSALRCSDNLPLISKPPKKPSSKDQESD